MKAMKTLIQILAIARTEFRFGLRRGAPVVVTAAWGLILGAALMLDMTLNLPNYDPGLDQFSPEQAERFAQQGITAEVFRSLTRDQFADQAAGSATNAWFFAFLGLLFLPAAAIGAIPADRQFGAWELLRSTPLQGGTYLAGKILGLCAIVTFIGSFPLLLFFAVLEGLLLAHFQAGIPPALLWFYLKLALMDGLPILWFATALGALAGVAFRSRRAAILPGFAAGMLSLYFWTTAFKPPPVSYSQFDLAAYHVFQGYRSIGQATWARLAPDMPLFDNSLLGADAPVVGTFRVLGMYLVVLGVLAGIAGLARLWLKWREDF
jgi:ABC-type transport system involved in multi-copper enzyme maturation permease subunit